MIKHGGAVGGPYKTEEIANEHLVTLSKKYYNFSLVVEERDIHRLSVHKRALSHAIS